MTRYQIPRPDNTELGTNFGSNAVEKLSGESEVGERYHERA